MIQMWIDLDAGVHRIAPIQMISLVGVSHPTSLAEVVY